MRSYEHRFVGDAATETAMVNAGGESADEASWLSFGDVVALSGDDFAGDALFEVARVPGQGGTRVETRDEIVCALKVASVDEAAPDPRFERDGRFGHFAFSSRADRSDVERAVRDRHLSLAAVNDDHFVAPGTSHVRTEAGPALHSPPTGTSTRWPWTRPPRSVASEATSHGRWPVRPPRSTT